MNQDALKALATELTTGIKTEKDLGDLTQQRVELTVETALNAELDDHLGYDKHDPSGRGFGNSRHGHSRKRLKGQHGEQQRHPQGDSAAQAVSQRRFSGKSGVSGDTGRFKAVDDADP